MAHFGKDVDVFRASRGIHIRSSEQTEHFTLYIITVKVGTYCWTVKHRYREFYQLHEKLVASYKLDRSLLPPKKIFGNQTESFIKKRQLELEIYLQTIVMYLAQHIPSCLAYFLDFDKYEIHGITQAMAEDLYSRGEFLLLSREKYEVSTLQLHSLTERLKLPEPTCDSGDVKKDLGHILDFITRVKYLKVLCSNKPVGSSNILMSKLPFDLTLFKSLQILEMHGCSFKLVSGLQAVKQTIIKFGVHESSSSLKEILLQDAPHWRPDDGSVVADNWTLTTQVSLSHNTLSEIDESIQLMPNIERLNLSHNQIENIQNLHWLSQLTHLDLSYNFIHHVDSLHTKLGNVKCVRLAYNHLESLHGFAKLFSLKSLDISHNKISLIDDVRFVAQLPCIEELNLEGNPVTSSLDYRTKTLEMFGERVTEILLDNRYPDQKELDTVAVLQALKKAKDAKIMRKLHPKKNTSNVSLSDMYYDSVSSSLSDHPDDKESSASFAPSGVVSKSVPTSAVKCYTQDAAHSRQSSSLANQGSVLSHDITKGRKDDSCASFNASLSSDASCSINGAVKTSSENCNNSSIISGGNSSADLMCTHLSKNIPEAHPFDLPIGSSSFSTVSPKAGSSIQPDNSGKMMTFNVTDLPTIANSSFLVWLNKHLFTSSDVMQLGNSESSQQSKESIIDIVWCYTEQLSKPSILFPCCAVLTRRRLFIERLTGQNSSFPVLPDLRICCMMSLQNIQQLVLGPCHAFLRLEEAFVGKSGVFTLFGIEPHELKEFFVKLFNACCDLDVINGYSFVDLTVQSDLLKTLASREEQSSGIASDRLVSAALVQVNDSSVFSFLVLSENKVYCLDLDCVRWPPATFETSPDTSIRVNIQHEFSIMDTIKNINICPSEKCIYNDRARISGSQSIVQFVHYELTLEVALSSENTLGFSNPCLKHYEGMSETSERGSGSISYFFPSPACRDLFLDRLSNMRAELAHRMSPHLREEPEGGNEQLSPYDRHKAMPSSSSVLKSRVILDRVEPASPVLKTAPRATTTETSIEDLKKIQTMPGLRQGSHSIYMDSKYGENSSIKKSETSNNENGLLSEHGIYKINVDEYHSQASSSAYYTSSPKEDLSVSPMSNFSRASISPDVGQTQEINKQMHCLKTNRFTHNFTTAETRSLPDSFDWKQYYFINHPHRGTDETRSEFQNDLRDGVSSNTSTQFPSYRQTPNSFLEAIESSSEFDSVQKMETEHELYLKSCIKSYDLIYPLSSKLKPLCLMNGRELRKFFCSTVAQKVSDYQDSQCEELHYVLWTMVVPYTNPKQEITTLVLMSTNGIYLMSDTRPEMAHKSRPSWMTHSRNSSDSAITARSGKSSGTRKLVEPYFIFRYKDLLQVNIGLFDQCVRLTGSNENSVFTLAIRDSATTATFIDKLKYVLSMAAISPVVEKSRAETESDFYRSSHQYMKSTIEGIVYTHPSQVKFVYPGEDAVQDILYLVNERTNKGMKASAFEVVSKLWFYMQGYLLPPDDARATDRSQPRSVLITAASFCLAEEDIVTYPLPDFVRGVPENPCHEIVECRQIDSLKRITLFHSLPHIICLTFADETEGIVVDVSMQHFGKVAAGKEKQHLCPEVTYRLYVQSVKERDKMVQVLDILWKGLVTQIGRILDISKI